MASSPLPFVDDNFNAAENPNEVKPTKDNPRFPLIPPKPNVSDESFTKAGLKFAERLVEATNSGRPKEEHIAIDDVSPGLIRMFEAADASTNQNVSYLSAGTLKTSSTGDGELFSVDVLLNPLAICPDPMNGRTMIDAILQGRKLLTPSGDAEGLDLPLFDLPRAADLVSMVDVSTAELGFSGQVAPGKDYQDLISVGLQGVHEPILVVPTCYRTPDGAVAWLLVALDGNRRLAMTMRALEDSSGLKAGELTAWRRHLFTADGVALADLDAGGVNAIRRVGQFNDKVGGIMYPASNSSEDVDAFLSGPAGRSIRLRTLTRCRSIRAQLVLGINPQTLAMSIDQEASKASALVQRLVRRRHIAEAAQKAWSDDAQNMQVATSALRRVESRIDAGADDVPLSKGEIASVVASETTNWSTAPDDSKHPLRMAAKVLATLACDDHDGTPVVKEEMKAFNMPVSRHKIAERRASLATERAMPILGHTDPSKARYRQVRTVIDRALRSRAFTECGKHPDPATPWWSLLNLCVEDLVARAEAEKLALEHHGSGTEDQGAGPWGPATRALVLLALLAMTASPALADGKGAASPFILTLSGLGGSRGVTKTTPDHVMFRLAKQEKGLEQLGEVISAALDQPRTPRNIIAPEIEVEGNPSTKGYLTEEFFRGETMGWKRGDEGAGDEGGSVVEHRSTYDQFTDWQQQFIDLASQLAQTAEIVNNGGEDMQREFKNHGLASEELDKAIVLVTDVANRGRIYREMSGE